MKIDPYKKKVVLIMKHHELCPIFTECGTMVVCWPMVVFSESSGCCVEALNRFLQQIPNSLQSDNKADNQEFECALKTCKGKWMITYQENGLSGNDVKFYEPIQKENIATPYKPPKKGPFLSAVPPYVVSSLISFSNSRNYEKGEVILFQGKSADFFYILQDGSVEIIQVETNSDNTDDEAVIGELETGECFGEMSLLTGEPTSACVRAKLPSTVLSVEKDDFYALMQLHPEFSIYLTHLLAGRIRSTNMRLRHILDEGMVGRIGTVPILDLVQNLYQSGRSGVVEMRQGATQASFGLQKGNVIFAISDKLEGNEAFYELCSWEKGTFVFYSGRIPPEKNICLDNTMQLLLETIRRLDELDKPE